MAVAVPLPSRRRRRATFALGAIGATPLLVLLVLLLVATTAVVCVTGSRGRDPVGQLGDTKGRLTPELTRAINTVAARFRVDPIIVGALAMRETAGGTAIACSSAGACGAMQLMPGYWAANRCDGDRDGRLSINDVDDNVCAAVKGLIFEKRTLFRRKMSRREIANMARSYCGSCTDAACGGGVDGGYCEGVIRNFQRLGGTFGRGPVSTDLHGTPPRTTTPATRPAALASGAGRMLRPTSGPFTSPFGQRWGRLHAGIDIAPPQGTPILSVLDGTVVLAGALSGYGNYTCIRHRPDLTTCYGHQQRWAPGIHAGARVRRGQTIGYVGNTGNSTGPHLHFEVRRGPDEHGRAVDPMPYLRGTEPPATTPLDSGQVPGICPASLNSSTGALATGNGRWRLAPNTFGHGAAALDPLLAGFLDRVALLTSRPFVLTTGSIGHAATTTNGSTSEHSVGRAGDFGAAANRFPISSVGPRSPWSYGDELATAALIAAGLPPNQARQQAHRGGITNVTADIGPIRIRVQVIWRSNDRSLGGDHTDHVHIGVLPLGPRTGQPPQIQHLGP